MGGHIFYTFPFSYKSTRKQPMRIYKHLTYQIKLTLLCGIAMLLLSTKGNAQFSVNGKVITASDSIAQVCINSPVRFTSTVPGTIGWTFTGASVATASGATTTVTYASTGVFNAEQTVTSPDTNYVFKATIVVNDNYPTASFKVTPPASRCASEFFRFTNTSPGNISSSLWSLGSCYGGATTNQKDIVIDFPTAVGSSNVDCPITLTVTNNYGCSASVSELVPAKQFPDVNVEDISGPTVIFQNVAVFRICGAPVPATDTFFNTSKTAATNAKYSFAWQNDPNIFTTDTWPAEGIPHVFGEGYTNLTLTVTGNNGCSKQRYYLTYVSPQATPNVTLNAALPSLICTPQNLEFAIGQNGNPVGTRYRLTLNDNVSAADYNSQPPPARAMIQALRGSCGIQSTDGTTTYPNALTATVVASHPCGSATASLLPIYASAKAKAGISGASSLCVNTQALVGNTGNYGSVVTVQNGVATCTYTGKMAWEISPATYTIDSGSLGSTNGDYSSINSWQAGTDTFKITFTDTGTYTIKQYIGNGTCNIDSIVKSVCVSRPSTAAFTLNTRQGCPNNTIFKTTNTTPPATGPCGGESYLWTITPINRPGCKSGNIFTFENNTSTTSKDIELSFEEKGLYEIRLVSRLSPGSPCFTEFIDTVGIYDKPDASISTLAEICAGDPLSPKAVLNDCLPNRFQTYRWKFVNGTPTTAADSTPVARYNTPGNTYMTLETTNACGTDRDTAYILVNEKPLLDRVSDTTICSNNPINLALASSSGSNTLYTWTSTVISGTNVAGNTSLTKQNVLNITDKLTNTGTTTAVIEYKIIAEPTTLPFKCPSDSATVYVTVLPQIQAGLDTLLCLGKTLPLNAIGTNVVKWSWTPATGLSNANIANPVTTTALTTSTTFYVTGTTALGCSNTDSINVDVTPPFILSASPKDAFSCIDSAVQLQATGGLIYAWSPATSLSDPNIANPIAKPSQTTTYTVTSSDQYNCEVKTDAVTVTVGGFTNVNISSNSTQQVIAGTEIPLFASTDSVNIKSYTWSATPSDGGALQCQNAAICSQQLATVYKDVTFAVQVENVYGCKQTDSISFKASCISEKQLFVPTAFSPDGNSLNDVFTILGQGFTINYFKIYNRWGNIVFERKEGGKPNDKAYGWNGKLKDGGMAPSGNYTCIVEVTCTAGGIFSYKGNVTLIR